MHERDETIVRQATPPQGGDPFTLISEKWFLDMLVFHGCYFVNHLLHFKMQKWWCVFRNLLRNNDVWSYFELHDKLWKWCHVSITCQNKIVFGLIVVNHVLQWWCVFHHLLKQQWYVGLVFVAGVLFPFLCKLDRRVYVIKSWELWDAWVIIWSCKSSM